MDKGLIRIYNFYKNVVLNLAVKIAKLSNLINNINKVAKINQESLNFITIVFKY